MKQMAFRTSARVTHPSNLQLPEDCTPRLPAVPLLWRQIAQAAAVLLLVAVAAYVLPLWAFAGSPDLRGTF
jgi:hypothetical protein